VKKFSIIPISEIHVVDYHAAFDSVAREQKYLAYNEAPPLEYFRKFVIDSVKQDGSHFLALMNNRVIGWCNISSFNRPIFVHSGSLVMGVVDGFRRIGVGESLLQATLDKAKENGLTRVELKVRENNIGAIMFYKKLGFVVEGVHPNAVRVNQEYESLLTMGLILSS
jgi:RimJ/RimL family protein N-acetyltransferase